MDNGKYRKLVITGMFYRSWVRGEVPGRIYIVGLEIVYLLMYFWTLRP